MSTRPDMIDPTGSAPADDGSTGGRPPSDLVRSVSRAFTVLEVVGVSGAALSAKAIARRTGLNLSTTYHLLHTLCWEGYLVRLPSGDFHLGAGISRRYRDLVSTLSAPPPMRQVLHRLTTHTGYTGFLGRLLEGRIAVTDVIQGATSPLIDELTPGFDEAATITPLGQVLQGTTSSGAAGSGSSGLVIEDGRPRPDLSSAVVAIRRSPAVAGAATRWAIGLIGPVGAFSGAAPALRALIKAGEQLAPED